jgi:hypothetical protein
VYCRLIGWICSMNCWSTYVLLRRLRLLPLSIALYVDDWAALGRGLNSDQNAVPTPEIWCRFDLTKTRGFSLPSSGVQKFQTRCAAWRWGFTENQGQRDTTCLNGPNPSSLVMPGVSFAAPADRLSLARRLPVSGPPWGRLPMSNSEGCGDRRCQHDPEIRSARKSMTGDATSGRG